MEFENSRSAAGFEMPKKPEAERARVRNAVADLRARRELLGLKRLGEIWAHPDDHQAIREFADRLQRRRMREQSKSEQ
jgi:hypothetical protein